MTSLIISGTDTDVGKTLLSSLLMAALPEYSYWKPVQSGTEEESDNARVERLSQCASDRILPERYVFQYPRSPHEAAGMEGKRIDRTLLSLLPDTHPVIIEGAGGLLVPLNEETLYIDMFKQWELPVLLACRSGLGTINHTLLSLEALRSRRIPILGVVTLGAYNKPNEDAMEHYGHTSVLGRIPLGNILHFDDLKRIYKEEFSRCDEALKLWK